jgi:PAS domain S-box-containing protein
MRETPLHYLSTLLSIAALYALLGKAALLFFAANGVVSVVWPPSGLALAAMLIGGKRYIPGVFLGACLVNTMTGLGLGVSAAIAVGNTLEAMLGVWLLTRAGRFDRNLGSLSNYLQLAGLAGFLACGVAALNGATTLLLVGFLNQENYLPNTLKWWMGDVLGVILVAPLILTWRRLPVSEFAAKRAIEIVLVLGLTVLAGQIVFLGWFAAVLGKIALGYWMFLFVAWVAVRVGSQGVASVLVIVACQALIGAAQGIGFFARDLANTELTNYWFYMVVLSFVGMSLAAYLAMREQAQASLGATAQYTRRLIEASLDPLVTISHKGMITDVNVATEQVTGIGRATLIGSDFSRYFTDPERARAGYQQVFSQGQVRDYPLTILSSSGRMAEVLYNASVYRDNEGEVLGIFAAARDVTVRKKAEEALSRANADLQRFTEVTAHHLQEPARRIASYADLLGKQLSGKLDDSQAKLSLDFINQQARYLQNLLRDVQRYLAADQPMGTVQQVDTPAVVAQVVHMLAPQVAASGAQIAVGELPPVWFDAQRLGEVFELLLDNALRHGVPGNTPARPLHIRVEGACEGAVVRLRVSDNGPGIEAQYHERVFRAFERLQAGSTDSGIGLALVRRIVESAGGRTWIEDAAGGGCCVCLELPQVQTKS